MTTPTPPRGRGGSSSRPYRRPQPDAPRRAAYDTLQAVRVDDAYANLVLPGLLRDRALKDRDAAFATELAYGTLRASGTYDVILARCIDRPLDQVDGEVLDV
ncbi:MAG TPA: transcription antitermination factor NusB, partial [Candidatus Limnocylindria bacterium]|nr:transcription antitermination factor NusB [Candidatus Limnocylindria bacterium]